MHDEVWTIKAFPVCPRYRILQRIRVSHNAFGGHDNPISRTRRIGTARSHSLVQPPAVPYSECEEGSMETLVEIVTQLGVVAITVLVFVAIARVLFKAIASK